MPWAATLQWGGPVKKWHHERRWKVRTALTPAHLGRVLTKFSEKGWSVHNILPQGAWRFVVVVTRTVKVYE